MRRLIKTCLPARTGIQAGFILLLGFVVLSCKQLSPAQPVTINDVLTEISDVKLRTTIAYLAGDRLAGRGSGSPEGKKAAEFISEQFRNAGLKSFTNGTSYLQSFTSKSMFGDWIPVLTKDNSFKISSGEKTESLAIQDDYIPFSTSSTGTIKSSVVFAGYGITAPEYNYDDYKDADVKDKIVLMLRYEPQEKETNSPFNGTNYTKHAALVNKVRNAREHGAKAVLLVTGPNYHEGEADVLQPIQTPAGDEQAGIPFIQLKREVAERLFKENNLDLTEYQKAIDENLKPNSFTMAKSEAEISVGIRYEKAPPLSLQNVAGWIEGSDQKLKEEAIVIGAHYDHLGRGRQPGAGIYYGADDNASGTSVLIGLAQAFGKLTEKPKRSIIFIAFDGEEIGLAGSAYYTKNPLWKLDKTVLMINLDMIGRLKDNKLYVFGSKTSPLLAKILDKSNETVKLDIRYSGMGYGGDQASFYKQKIPYYFLHTGGHADYHRPSDTIDKINMTGISRIARLALFFTNTVANREERPEFKQLESEGPPPVAVKRPTLGVVPDFSGGENGLLVDDVIPDSPAAKGGFKKGDLITKIDDHQIANLKDLAAFLAKKKAGDKVKVFFTREGKEMETEVTLAEGRR